MKLLVSHIRDRGDDTQHSCPICLSLLYVNPEILPSWLQCPSCQTVMHERCLLNWIARCDDETFSCPSCRHTFSCHILDQQPDNWSADDAIEKCLEQDSKHDSCYEVKSGDARDEARSRRVLRSNGAPREAARRLRSHGAHDDY